MYYVYIYIYTCMYAYIYIYIYILFTYMYIYMYAPLKTETRLDRRTPKKIHKQVQTDNSKRTTSNVKTKIRRNR